MPGTINLAPKAGEVTGPRDEPTNILFLNRHSIKLSSKCLRPH